VLVVLLSSLVSALLILSYASGDTVDVGEYLSTLSRGEAPWSLETLVGSGEVPEGEPASEPLPEQADASPAAAAYQLVASEFPGIGPESVQGVYQSKYDPSWASVRLAAPKGDEGTYVVFLQREDDSWKAQRSIRADEPEHPEYERVVLDGVVPEDLVGSLYPQSLGLTEPSGLLMDPIETGTLPSVEVAKPPTPEVVTDEVPEEESERVDEGLEEASQVIEAYATEHEGTAGVYVRDLNGGYGYGVNPDEVFFGASVMKIPLIVAVFRKMDEGAFALSDRFATEPGDWAGGAGWLQWEEAGEFHTVEDYLLMTMTQSDNVATNALLRLVGGPEYVNEVARSLGAENTVLYQKITSERAIVPSLDNRTTPRDMALIMEKISTGRAASPESSQEIVEIMDQNRLQSSLRDGLPEGIETANKGGWLYKVYDEAALVWHEGRPYVVAIFSKHGSEDTEEGKALLKGISESIWQAQDG
jgi:beta-lactamase class A